MQILGHVSSTHELLYATARQVSRTFREPLERDSHCIDRHTFMSENPYHALNSYFQELEGFAEGYRFILAIDEFEKIEEKIRRQQLSEDLLEFLRGLTQTYR